MNTDRIVELTVALRQAEDHVTAIEGLIKSPDRTRIRFENAENNPALDAVNTFLPVEAVLQAALTCARNNAATARTALLAEVCITRNDIDSEKAIQLLTVGGLA